MREVELNAIFEITPDPDKNYVNIKDFKIRQEVERIARVFDISNAQKEAQGGRAFKNLVAFDLVGDLN